jgi:hypothetical protein
LIEMALDSEVAEFKTQLKNAGFDTDLTDAVKEVRKVTRF